jgi:hypothetical protein
MAIEEVKGNEIQIVDYRNAKAAREAFESFKKSVLTADDFYKQGNKLYVRKSGWMMYAMALGITTHVYNERSESVKFKGQDALVYHFEAKAVAPNGRSAEAIGSASSDEGKPWCDAIHSIRAMAQTRAVERSISNLVGGGEVGADEMDTKSVDAEYRLKENPPLSKTLSDSEVTGEQDLLDAIAEAGLDPQKIEVITKDFGKFIVKPNWPKPATDAENPWRAYNKVINAFGGKYHGSAETNPDFKYNWTIGV